MHVPPGYNKNVHVNTICRLKKALYGLKQSSRSWFGRFVKVMTSLECMKRQEDHTLFIKHSLKGGVTVLLVYVDAIIMTKDDWKEQKILSQCLASEFEVLSVNRGGTIPKKHFYISKNTVHIYSRKR